MFCYQTFELARGVFDSLVRIRIGKGDRVLFWTDRWMDGSCVQDIAPLVLNLVNTRRRSKTTVQEAFQNDRWTTDIMGDLPPMDTCNINMFSCA
jgi:hypothetical protein